MSSRPAVSAPKAPKASKAKSLGKKASKAFKSKAQGRKNNGPKAQGMKARGAKNGQQARDRQEPGKLPQPATPTPGSTPQYPAAEVSTDSSADSDTSADEWSKNVPVSPGQLGTRTVEGKLLKRSVRELQVLRKDANDPEKDIVRFEAETSTIVTVEGHPAKLEDLKTDMFITATFVNDLVTKIAAGTSAPEPTAKDEVPF